MSALADYYAAAANEKNANVPLLGQQANLTAEQAKVVAPNAEADQFAHYAGGNAALGESAAAQQNANTNANRAVASNVLDYAQAGETNQRAATIGPLAQSQINSTSVNTALAALGLRKEGDTGSTPGFAKGTSNVDNRQSPGPTDRIPALLSPNEAVLNSGAVDHYGPDVIDHMNRMGLMRSAAHKELVSAMKKASPKANTIRRRRV